MVEPAGEILVAAGEALEVIDVFHEGRQHGVGPLPRPFERHRDRRRQGDAVGRRPILEGCQCVAEIDLGAPQPEESIDERAQLPGLHECLAGEAHESRQAVRRNPHDPVARLEGQLGGGLVVDDPWCLFRGGRCRGGKGHFRSEGRLVVSWRQGGGDRRGVGRWR